MTPAKLLRCSCGGIPNAEVYRVAEDLMEAIAKCNRCGKTSDPIEHVWGGLDAKMWAYEEWNHMRHEEEAARESSGG